jgi:hypothetical protein
MKNKFNPSAVHKNNMRDQEARSVSGLNTHNWRLEYLNNHKTLVSVIIKE